MDEIAEALLGKRLIAKLSTLKRDGSPHLVAVWFLWDGEFVTIPTNHATQKVKNLERDPRAAVLVDDARPGLEVRGVSLAGSVEIVRAPESLQLNHSIHAKYMTEAGFALAPVRAYLDEDDVTLQFRPKRIFTWDPSATDASRQLMELGGAKPLD